MSVSGEPSPVLTLEAVTVRRDSTLLLDDVTRRVPAGACTVVVGPSAARALADAPRVLLLDEPTSALDTYATKAMETVTGELMADGMSVVVVSHDTAQLRRIADHVLVLENGWLIDSGSVDTISSPQEGV